MGKLKKHIPHVVEFCIYKHFPFTEFLCAILLCTIIALPSGGKKRRPVSIKQSAIAGAAFAFIWFLPAYLSALIMNLMQKPVLRFDTQGFYYTPQLWSKNKLYVWESIEAIEVTRDKKDKDKIFINVYLSNKTCISINETIIPIEYHQLIQIFSYRLKNIVIKKCF